MSSVFIFPGQGAQFSGMGKNLYELTKEAKPYFDQANEILGFDIKSLMFEGSADDLKQTKVTQPAIFIHSFAAFKTVQGKEMAATAGHSLGEFTALAASGALSFADGLKLVQQRAEAMQEATEQSEGTMAAILGLEDSVVESVCQEVSGTVIAANYNCPGQLVISGEKTAIEAACELAKGKGAKRALPLPVGGAFHSPLMEPAREKLAHAIEATVFQAPVCPIYQNVDAKAHTNPSEIKQNLINQLTAPVRWTQTVQNIIADGHTSFIECGPGKVLAGLVKKTDRSSEVVNVG
jgi:[acyl-carrier-protein] S-malonyltransferase